jgi:hypothetical protein
MVIRQTPSATADSMTKIVPDIWAFVALGFARFEAVVIFNAVMSDPRMAYRTGHNSHSPTLLRYAVAYLPSPALGRSAIIMGPIPHRIAPQKVYQRQKNA